MSVFYGLIALNTNDMNKIEKAILCGTGGNKKDFVEKFMSEGDVEYSPADVWLNMSSRGHVPEIPLDESLDYASAIGLVLSHTR